MLEINNTLLIKQKKALEAALSTDPDTVKRLREIIRTEIKAARDRMVADVPFKYGDPRGARNAIRHSVYKRVLGGQVNIFSSRKAGAPNAYQRPRKLDANPHQRGGNRRKVSEETKRMNAYGGHDRGMILRWLNSGTGDRNTKYGFRGRIAGNNWFTDASVKELTIASDNLEKLVEEELNNIVAEKMN